MKTEILKNLLLLAVLPLAMAQCGKIQEPEPDSRPSGNTVTLTVRSADTENQSKTMLEDDKRVIWTWDDMVYVNDSEYQVMPDESDPAFGTVEVMESDEYFAFYSPVQFPEFDGENYYLYIGPFQDYVSGSFYRSGNPMAAYSTSTDLQFHNLGSVIRIGVTGDVAVSEISITGNKGEYLSGYLSVPQDDIKSGSYASVYPVRNDDENYFRRVFMGTDVYLDPAAPTYFYFGVAPQTLEEGFTVYVKDPDGNVAIQSTSAATDAFRSEIVAKEPFSFEPAPAPEITELSAGATTVSGTVQAVRGAWVKAAAFLKSDWENIGEGDRDYCASEAMFNSDAVIAGPDGTCTFILDKAFTPNYTEAAILPENEYVVVVDYSDIYSTLGLLSSVEVTTAAPSGEAPNLYTVLESGDEYYKMNISISAGNASSVSWCILPVTEYQSLISDGYTESRILAERGLLLSDEELSEALSGGFYTEITNYAFIPDTEYILVTSAISEGGMETVSNASGTTSAHLDPNAEWQTVSNAYADHINFDIHTLGVSYYYNGELSVEKIQGENIFRMHIPFYSDETFVTRMQEEGFICTYEDCYLYFDGTFEGGGMMLMPPFESYIGFTTQDELPLYVTTRDMPGYMDFGGEYLNAGGKFSLWAGSSVADMADTGHIGSFSINVQLLGGIPVSGGASNENYEIKDEVAWD